MTENIEKEEIKQCASDCTECSVDTRDDGICCDEECCEATEAPKEKSFLWVGIVLAVLSVLAFLAAAQSNARSTSVDNLPEVRYVNFKVFDPVYIGIEKGFFESRGVDVKIIGDVLAGPNAIQAVAGGSAEAGLSSVPAIINSNAAGLPIQGVVDVQTTLDGQPLQRWFVRADSDIHSVSDLVGKDYAINIRYSSFHYTSLLMLDENDIDEEDVNFRLLSFSDQIPALMEGEVDVIGLIPPYQGYLLQEYGDEVRELWNDYDLYGERHVSLIFVNRLWAQYNHDEATAFVMGIVDSINWIEENQEEAGQIVEQYTGVPASAIGDYHFTEGGKIDQAYVQVWLDYLLERGDTDADWLNVNDIAGNDYIE